MPTKKKATKAKITAETPNMIPIASIQILEDTPNRSAGWEKDLNELMYSIKSSGQIQPIVVIPLEENGDNGKETCRLVAGRRRLEAIKRLNQNRIKAVSLAPSTNKKGEFGAHVAENFGRKDHSPMEAAALIEYAVKEIGITQQEFAKIAGKTPGWVSQHITAAKQPPEVQQALETGEITFTHVRELARVKDEDKKKRFLEAAKKENAQEFKERVNTSMEDKKPKKKKAPNKNEIPFEAPTDKNPVRPKREAVAVLGKLTKAFAKAKEANNKERTLELSNFIKGVSWSYKLKGANLPKL